MAIHPDTMRFHIRGMGFYLLKYRPFGDDSPVIILGHGEDSFGWLKNCWKIFRKNRKLLVLPNRKLLVLPFKPGPLFFPNSGRACLPWNLWTKYELGSSFEKEKYLQRPTRTIMGRILHPSTSLFCKDKSMRCSMFQVEWIYWSRDFVQCVKNYF